MPAECLTSSLSRHSGEGPPAWMQVVEQRLEQAAEVVERRREQAAEESSA